MNIEEIRARAGKELTFDDYKRLKICQIAQIRLDRKWLLSEVDRLTAENGALIGKWEAALNENAALKAERDELKRALKKYEDLGTVEELNQALYDATL